MAIDPATATVAATVIATGGAVVKDFVKRSAGPLADEIGELLADRLREYRSKNARDVVESAARLLEVIGETAHEIPPRNLLPILEGASLEDDAGMKSRWSSLLANAARTSGQTFRPIYATTLGQLAPVDAVTLQTLADLQASATPADDGWGVPYLHVISEVPELMRSDVLVSLDTLRGLGLINGEPSVRLSKEGAPMMTDRAGVALSNLGRQFLEACSPPVRNVGISHDPV